VLSTYATERFLTENVIRVAAGSSSRAEARAPSRAPTRRGAGKQCGERDLEALLALNPGVPEGPVVELSG